MNAVLYELGIHGKWQVQVLIELQSLTPTSMETPWDLPYSGLSRLPYLRAIVKESLRLSPPFPSAFQREVSMNSGAVTIAGFAAALPPGTKISTNHYVMCRSRAVFGTDADEFHPERWLDTNDSEQLKRMEDAWSVFGRGARMCVGKDLVIMMLYKAVAAVRTFPYNMLLMAIPNPHVGAFAVGDHGLCERDETVQRFRISRSRIGRVSYAPLRMGSVVRKMGCYISSV